MTKLWLLVVWEDVESEVLGPYETDDQRLDVARAWRRQNEGGVYRLDINESGVPITEDFSGGEIADEEV